MAPHRLTLVSGEALQIMATASLFLAAKTAETPRLLKEVMKKAYMIRFARDSTALDQYQSPVRMAGLRQWGIQYPRMR